MSQDEGSVTEIVWSIERINEERKKLGLKPLYVPQTQPEPQAEPNKQDTQSSVSEKENSTEALTDNTKMFDFLCFYVLLI